MKISDSCDRYTIPEFSPNVDCESTRKPKNNLPTWRQNFRHYFTEYCSNTSIHGIKFLGEFERTIVEKIWWIIFIGVSLYFCITLIIKTYEKWERSPVIVSFATSLTPIWQIPFPAVTICPELKSKQTVFNFTKVTLDILQQKNLTDEDVERFGIINLICNVGMPMNFLPLQNSTTDESIIDFLTEAAPNASDIFFKCTWLSATVSCEELFTPILTDEGICFTFNMLNRSKIYTDAMVHYNDFSITHNASSVWTLETGYANDQKVNTYPRRALMAGIKAGLSVTLLVEENDADYACGNLLQGFKVLLHHPAEIPQVSELYFRVPQDQSIIASLKPVMMTTDEKLRDYDHNERQCYFPNEKNLHYFKIYTQKSCQVECLANFTLSYCRCVDFHMPRNIFTPICGPGSINCSRKAQKIFLNNELQAKIEQTTKSNKLTVDVLQAECDCLPSCMSLSYDTETSQVDWNWLSSLKVYEEAFSLTDLNATKEHGHLSHLVVFFKEMQFITLERNELFGPTDFLANCGGLLGLFTGFSVISLVEILYFISVRLICNIIMYGKHYWSGAQELLPP